MEQESSVLQKLHNTIFEMESDQKKYDLLLSISDLIDETLSAPINTSDIELPSDVITKGRPKNTKNSRIPSKFETEEIKNRTKVRNKKAVSESEAENSSDDNNKIFIFPQDGKRKDCEMEFLKTLSNKKYRSS